MFLMGFHSGGGCGSCPLDFLLPLCGEGCKLSVVCHEQKRRLLTLYRRWSPATLAELAKQYNPAIQGSWNSLGAFYRTAMHKLYLYIDQRLEQWARRKYKTLLRRERRSVDWLRRMKNESPRSFHD